MKITEIAVNNYKSLKDVHLYPKNIFSLVGKNNSGKSNVLQAINLFFDFSTKNINKESFYNKKPKDYPFTIKIVFSSFTPKEREKIEVYLVEDKLFIERKATCKEGVEDSYILESAIYQIQPDEKWLQQNVISTDKITEWWNKKDELKIGELNFVELLGIKKPGVKEWKQKSIIFIKNNMHLFKDKIKCVVVDHKVINDLLPPILYIPAIRELSDETKINKTNPFGILIGNMKKNITPDQQAKISAAINSIEKYVSPSGSERIEAISQLEEKISEKMKRLIDGKVQLVVTVPDFSSLLEKVQVNIDDGINTLAENKGHGMQRALILAILETYAEINYEKPEDKTLSTLFLIEEPELYLHPQAQRTMMSVLRTISNGIDQVIYCTQSNIFVDIAHFDEIGIMRRLKKGDNYESTSSQLSMDEMLKDLELRTGIKGTEIGIRELYSNAFNSIVNEGFFADKVIIVEGDSEAYSFPIYSKCCGFDLDQKNIAIVHSNGKGPINRILRIFNGFKIPTYVWFDGDKHGEKEIIDETMSLLELLGKKPNKIEELKTMFEDTFTVLEDKYETTLSKEVPEWEQLIQEAAKEMGPIGKPLKHRYIARRITKDVPLEKSKENVPPTILKIIEKVEQCEYKKCILFS